MSKATRRLLELLKQFICVNQHGVWLLKVDDNKFAPVPRWMWHGIEETVKGVMEEFRIKSITPS